MTWKKVDVPECVRKELSAYQVLACLQAVTTLSTYTVALEYADFGAAFDLVELFTARCIVELGETSNSEIAEILGINHVSFVEGMTRKFQNLGLAVCDGETIKPGERLGVAFASKRVIEKRVKDIEAVWDGSALLDLESFRPFLTTDGADSTHLPVDIAGREAIQGYARESAEHLGIDLISASQRGSPKFVSLSLLVAVCVDANNGEGFWIPVTASGHQCPIVASICRRLGAETSAREIIESQLFDKSSQEAEAPASTIFATMPPAAHSPHSSQILFTTTIQGRLIADVDAAQDEVVLVFPWINGVARDYFPAFKRAVKRGVRISIAYGFAETEQSEEKSDAAVLTELRAIDKISKKDGSLLITWLGKTHIKGAIFDRKVSYVGSFNALSFRGSAERLRGECMYRLENPTIAQEFLAGLREHQPLIKHFIQELSRNSAKDSHDLARRWIATLLIAPERETVDALILNATKLPHGFGPMISEIKKRLSKYRTNNSAQTVLALLEATQKV